jgi:cellulose biosynthesis protein BcsQ
LKKICFYLQKGGVGKTSISATIASGLAMHGRNTVFLDCDPQGNASSWYCTSAITYDIADVLAQRISVERATCQITDNLSMLPILAIDGNLKKWSETELVENPKAFEFLMQDLDTLGFEYAVFDCSPSFSQLERAIIAIVDEVINPLSPESFSVDGIEIFLSELRKIETSYRKRIKNNKIVLNMVNKSFARHREFQRVLEKLNYEIFVIPQDAKIAECQIYQKSLFDYAPKTKSIPHFNLLIDALLTQGEI